MTYLLGNIILATEFNNFVDQVNSIYSVGNGNTGYGQTLINLAPVNISDMITANDYILLRSAIALCSQHQGIPNTLLPPVQSFTQYQRIIAESINPPSNRPYDLIGAITAIINNKFVTGNGNTTLNSDIATATQNSAWGGIVFSNLKATVTVSWPSENEARYFFNSGGEIRFRLSHPTGVSSKDTYWNNLLSSLGIIKIKAHDVTNTGNVGTGASIGYYDLTDSLQTCFHIGSDTTEKGSNVNIQMKRFNYIGVNGGNGSSIIIEINLNELNPNFVNDLVVGTALNCDFLIASNVLQGITPPNYNVPTFINNTVNNGTIVQTSSYGGLSGLFRTFDSQRDDSIFQAQAEQIFFN